MNLNSGSKLSFLLLLICLAITQPVFACTDFLIKATDGSAIVGRSMEWGDDMKSQLVFHPRGEAHASAGSNGKTGCKWQSKYGFICANGYDLDTAIDGMNENGFSIGALWFPGAVYQNPIAGQDQSTIDVIDLGAWLLGNFATVDEATKALAKMRVCSRQRLDIGITPNLHFALHDSSGKSAVVEFINGEQRVQLNNTGVLTNAPSFDWHMTNLCNYIHLNPVNAQPIKLAGSVLAPPGQGSGLLGIPGDWTPPSRFIRTTSMIAFAQQPRNTTEAVSMAQHILNAVDIPIGDVRDNSGDVIHQDYTQWALIKDLSNRLLYFRSYDNLALQVIDLKRLNFDSAGKSQIPIRTESAIKDITANMRR